MTGSDFAKGMADELANTALVILAGGVLIGFGLGYWVFG